MAELTRAGLEYGSGVPIWSAALWRELAVAWMDEQLAAAGIERTGEVEQPRVRPWGTVLVAPTTRGQMWFKAPGPETAFEVGLYALLHRVAPEHVHDPVATDVVRGWIVLPDGGPVLGERATGQDLVDALVVVLPRYAQLQRARAGSARRRPIGVGRSRHAGRDHATTV